MKYKIVVLLVISVMLFSGCIDQITTSFEKAQVVYVNVSVVSEGNQTIIKDMQAKGGEISKLNSGAVLPEKFPAIYVEILQVYNLSKPGGLKTISLPNGQEFKGPGNYSFAVTLMGNSLNKSQPIYVYSEISTNKTRITRAEAKVNWTE